MAQPASAEGMAGEWCSRSSRSPGRADSGTALGSWPASDTGGARFVELWGRIISCSCPIQVTCCARLRAS